MNTRRPLCPLLLLLLSAAGCGGSSTTCKDDTGCVVAGSQGKCLPSPQSTSSWCAFAKADCASGLSWDTTAGDGLASQCVVGPSAGADLAIPQAQGDMATTQVIDIGQLVDMARSAQADMNYLAPDQAIATPPDMAMVLPGDMLQSNDLAAPGGTDGLIKDGAPAVDLARCGGGMVMCGNQCTNTMNDNKNCGRCGHDCCGGACVAGLCQAVKLASTVSAGWGVAIDAQPGQQAANVYWTEFNDPTGTVMKCAAAGCNNQPTQLASGQTNPQGIAVAGGNVYWTTHSGGNGGSVRKCAVGGCNNQPTQLYTGVNYPSEIAVDGTNAYWTAGSVGIFKCALGGCNNQPALIAAGLNGTNWIAVDATNVYWTGDDNVGTGLVLKCTIVGCNNAPATLATYPGFNGQGPYAITVDQSNVYWAGSDGAVVECAVGGCNQQPTKLGNNGRFGIAVDATNVYWTNYGGGVNTCAIAGCNGAPPTIAPALNPRGIAVDAACVYWVDGVSANKVAKP